MMNKINNHNVEDIVIEIYKYIVSMYSIIGPSGKYVDKLTFVNKLNDLMNDLSSMRDEVPLNLIENLNSDIFTIKNCYRVACLKNSNIPTRSDFHDTIYRSDLIIACERAMQAIAGVYGSEIGLKDKNIGQKFESKAYGYPNCKYEYKIKNYKFKGHNENNGIFLIRKTSK